MKTRLLLSIAGISLIGLSGLARLVGHDGRAPAHSEGPGRLEVEEPEVRWEPTSREDQTARIRFVAWNRGNTPVRILAAESGCGCTTLGVVPRLVLPGRSAVVVAEATPPTVGVKDVPITLRTDSATTPTVALRLRLTGTRRPPCLLYLVGDLTYSGDPSGDERRELRAVVLVTPGETRRPELTCNVPGLVIEPGPVTEEPEPSVGPNIVERSFHFTARFADGAPEGHFDGEVRAEDPWDPGRYERLVVLGDPTPRVRVAPALPVLRAGDREPRVEVLVLSREAAPDMAIEPDPTGEGPLAATVREPTGDGRVTRITVELRPDAEARAGRHDLVVRPWPDAPDRVVIPVTVIEEAAP